MSHTPLPHYLRLHRKRAGASQDEIALLLGAATGTKVSRHERFSRLPTLATALAYEVIYGVPAGEIFAGVYVMARRAVLAHASAGLERLRAAGLHHPGRRAWLEHLESLIHESQGQS